MFGAVQFGVLAACIVLFVPMGMAGWHLSRNKMLFFSGALFITLAVCVHLTPYFPSISNFVSSLSSDPIVVLESRDSCISLLHEVEFDVRLNTSREVFDSLSNYDRSWSWVKSEPLTACGFEKLDRFDASDLLNGSWVVVAGDSQARLVVVSLLNLVLGSEAMESSRADLFKRHSDYQFVADEIGMKLDFIWAPYVKNVTDLMIDYKRSRTYPDVLIMGSGLWHMLHVTDSLDYGLQLRSLRDSVLSMLPVTAELAKDGPDSRSISIRSPHLFWVGLPELINTMLNTEEKREKMTGAIADAYENEVLSSKLLHQSGGPLVFLEIRKLSSTCGNLCTIDGMHYDGVVYDAAVQIMLNALLIQSHQKL